MAKRRDFSRDEDFNRWVESYIYSVDKKYIVQGDRIYIRRKRTANSAVAIVDKLRKFKPEDININLTVDGYSNPIVSLYQDKLREARLNPLSFSDGLYQFYMNTGRRIKADHLEGLFLEIIAYVDVHREYEIFNAFMDLLMQQMEFLKSDTLDYNLLLAGFTTDGEPIEIQDPLPRIDFPIYKLSWLMQNNKPVNADQFLISEFRKIGYPGFRTIEDYNFLRSQSASFNINIICMAGFINEYTADMLPKQPLTSDVRRLIAPAPFDLSTLDDKLHSLLTRRHRTLPANGVRISFSSSRVYRVITIKEMFKYNDMYLLFKVESKVGDMSGRYNIRTGDYYTPLNRVNPKPEQFLSGIRLTVLWAYASIVCDDDTIIPTTTSYLALFDDPEASVQLLSLGTKLKTASDIKATRELDPDKYSAKEVPLNGYIRRLPDGQKASDRAKQLALALGFELNEGETYVQPFVRKSWVLASRSGTTIESIQNS